MTELFSTSFWMIFATDLHLDSIKSCWNSRCCDWTAHLILNHYKSYWVSYALLHVIWIYCIWIDAESLIIYRFLRWVAVYLHLLQFYSDLLTDVVPTTRSPVYWVFRSNFFRLAQRPWPWLYLPLRLPWWFNLHFNREPSDIRLT